MQSNRKLVLDEAFMDFVPKEQEHSLLKLASTSQQLVVIRSMTKFYSIPGIRLGFMVAHPDLIRQIATSSGAVERELFSSAYRNSRA